MTGSERESLTSSPQRLLRMALRWTSMSAGLGLASILLMGSTRRQSPTIAATPPMGWNTWYAFGCHDTEAELITTVNAMVSNGMKAAGYKYVDLDDCWQGERDAQGHIHSNSRFPDMRGLANYIHNHGLKFGVYSSPGPRTCGGYPGSYGYEGEDAETYASWGVDLLKYDWCSAEDVYKPDQVQQIEAAYELMHKAILKTGRPMVYSICEYGMYAPWIWGPKVGGNLWRTTDDISNRLDYEEYQRMMFVGFGQDGLQRYAGPGHWNNPDYLQIGNGGLDVNADKTQMSLWAILAAPLFVSTDLTKLTPQELSILINREVIAVDQDPEGIQGHRVSQDGPVQIWVRALSHGRMAVGLINSGNSPLLGSVNFRALGYFHAVRVRDLWEKRNLGTFKTSYTATVPKRGVVLIEIQ